VRAAEKYRNLDFDKFLNQLAGYAGSDLTRELINNIEVVFHPARIDENLDQTSEALRFLDDKPTVDLPAYRQLEDLNELLDRICAGELLDAGEARQMIRFLNLTQDFDRLLNHFDLENYPRLTDVAASWQPLDQLASQTKRIFNEEGEVRDSASTELNRIRSKLRQFESQVSNRISDILGSVRDHTGDEALLTIRNNRFVVLMPRTLAGTYSGNVVDVSGSGQSIYFEPAAVGEMNAERQHLFLAEDQEVRNILRDFSIQIASQNAVLRSNMTILVRYDYIFARAKHARALTANRPTLTRDGGYDLRRAIHPLLYKDFVPEDLVFDEERCLVISGVNAGGKTVLLKLLGMYSLISALGCFVSGDAKLPYISDVQADIGDDQSALANLSTFTAHLQFITNVWEVLANYQDGELPVLVLIDEIGTGTEPGEGAAFAYGVIQSLLELPVKLALTTHYDVLKTLAFERDDVKNVCLEFDQDKLQPTYNILNDQPGQSFAFAIARRWGVPEESLAAGEKILGKEERKMASIIAELEGINREARDTRNELRQKAAELDQVQRENERLTNELKAEKQRFAKHADHVKQQLENRVDELLKDTKRKLKNKARQSSRKQDEYVKAASKSAGVVRRQKEEIEETMSEILDEMSISMDDVLVPGEPIAVGDLAAVENSAVRGEVIEVDKSRKEAVLSYMSKRITVKLSKLTKVSRKREEKFDPLKAFEQKHLSSVDVEHGFEANLHTTSDQIDLHGQTTQEASDALDEFISQSLLDGINSIRVMHGVGTGRLRVFVQDYLRKNRHVRNVRFADTHDGGVGVTIADLV